MRRTYRASCHCGRAVVEADLDLAQGSFRCNCSICRRGRAWLVATPPEHFRLLAGEGELTEYVFGVQNIHHYFCRHCGIKLFGRVDVTPVGPLYAINVGCLEGVEQAEFAEIPYVCIDGANDRFDAPPEFSRHL